MEPQKIQYLGPKTEVEIGSLTLSSVSGMTVWSMRNPTADTCEILLPDLQAGYNSGAKVCYLTSSNYRLNESEERLVWKHVYSFNDIIEILKQRG